MQSKSPIVLIHGLFGDLNNLGQIARDLQNDFSIIQVDIRNHGNSPHKSRMRYSEMAQDVLTLLENLGYQRAILIGHSMGGKIAMAMTALAPDRIEKVVVIDMAPVAYKERRHDAIFAALEAVSQKGSTERKEAAIIMRSKQLEEGVIQFLLKSFHQGEWKFNLPVLKADYAHIISWDPLPPWNRPLLIIAGGNSTYVQTKDAPLIAQQFPHATAHIVAGADHWVHAEKPNMVIRAIRRFLSNALL